MWKPSKLEQNEPPRGGSGSGAAPPPSSSSSSGGSGASGGGTEGPSPSVVLASAVAAADVALRATAARGEALDATRGRQASREAARLLAKHGARAPIVVAAGLRAQARALEASAARVTAARARVPVVLVDPEVAVVHGRVIDAAHRGQAGVEITVQLGDHVLARARSDKDGYYRLTVSSAALAGTAGKHPGPARAEATVSLGATRNALPVLRSGVALTAVSGRVAYKELILEAEPR